MADNQTTTLEQDALEVIELSGAVLEKAASEHQLKVANDRAIQAAIPATVEQLILSGLLEPNEKQAATTALANPVYALEFLKLAAESYTAKNNGQSLPASQVNGNGEKVHQKAASAAIASNNHRDDFERQRDSRFDQDIGLQ